MNPYSEWLFLHHGVHTTHILILMHNNNNAALTSWQDVVLTCVFYLFVQYREVEDLYLMFAKKASTFNSWFENAEEDLTDPVRCNSVEEIRVPTINNKYIIIYFMNCK